MFSPEAYQRRAEQTRKAAAWAYQNIDRMEALRLADRHETLLVSTSAVTTFPLFEQARRLDDCRQITENLSSVSGSSIASLPERLAALLSDIALHYDKNL